MRMQRTLKVLVASLILWFTALPSIGQVSYDTATLQGSVLDAQDRVVPGAHVAILNAATGLTKSQQSSADGTYTFPLLPVGTYQVEVTAPGFNRAVASDVVLSVGQAMMLDLHLRVGETTATVVVTSEAPLFSVEQTQQANEITQSQVEALPNMTHTFDTYVLTLPGVTNIQAIRNSGSQRGAAFPVINAFTTSAGNGRGGMVTIDGGENDSGNGISRTYHLPVDAIEEFLVNRNGYNAEYGFSYDEVVTLVTKNGTNNYHGAAFGTFRDQATDAHQYFQPLTPSGNKFFDQEFHAGASVGGPLMRNKLFFFLAYEGYQNAFETSRNFINATYSPTFTQLPIGQQTYITAVAADVNPAHCSPVASCAALAADLTAALNPSNSAVVRALVGAPGNFLDQPSQTGNFTNKDTWHDAVVRFDWQPNSNDSFVLRGLLERRDNPGNYGRLENFQEATLPPDASNVLTNRDYEWVATWNHIFTPRLFNALRFQMIPEYVVNTVPNPAQNGPRIPFNVVRTYGNFGNNLGSLGNVLSEKRYQIEDSTSWTHGKHSLKFGLSFRPAKYQENNPLYRNSQIVYFTNRFNLYGLGGPDCAKASSSKATTLPNNAACGGTPLGSYTPPLTANDLSAISSFNSAAAGNAALFSSANLNSLQAFSGVVPGQFRTSFGGGEWSGWGFYGGIYAQDTWKVTPRLTISPGVRFDVNAEPFPTGGMDNNVCEVASPTAAAVTSLQTNLQSGKTCVQGGGILRSFQINPTSGHTNYVSPRIGFAFDLTGDGKTLLRASGGAFVGASELQAFYYANLYNPNGQYLIQEEVTPGVDAGYYSLIHNSTVNGHLPVLPPTLAEFNAANLKPVPDGPHGVFITAADHPCGGDNIFGCGAYRSTYSTQASISVQRQLWTNTSLEVGYVFQRTFHIQDPLETNYQQAVSGPTDPGGAGVPLIDPFNGPMLVPKDVNVETGTLYCSCGDAKYHGVTTSLKRQFASHFQFQVNYTWSRAVDNVLDFSSFNSSYYPTIYPNGINGHGRDWGISAYNTTHNLAANAVFRTPFKGGSGASLVDKLLANWTLSPIVTVRSGIPFEVFIDPQQGLATECTTVAGCAAGTANGNGLVQEAQNQARPYAAGRNTGFSPWNFRWDMSFRKAIPLNERFKLEFLANFANLLNRKNFLGVNGDFPGVTNQAAAQSVKLLNGSTVNLLSGPYNFHGFQSFNQAELSKTTIGGGTPLALGADPLAFVTADVPRQLQFELRLSF